MHKKIQKIFFFKYFYNSFKNIRNIKNDSLNNVMK